MNIIGATFCLPAKACKELFLLIPVLKHFNPKKILNTKSYNKW